MDGVSIGWLGVGSWQVVVPAASLALRVASQFHHVASGRGLTFIFLGYESFSLFSLASGTRLHFLAPTLGLRWKDLEGVVMICLHLINSAIFCNDGKDLTSVTQELYLMTCALLSYL